MWVKLDFPPGLYRQGTDYQTKGRYADANLMRWFEGTLRPIPAWVAIEGTPLTGIPRAAHAWLDDDEAPWLAVGTTTKLYAWDGAAGEDITPSGFTPGDADAATWSLDNFSENLIACNDGEGIIYEWNPVAGGDAAAVPNAPAAKFIFTTQEKILVALGIDGDPRALGWSDIDDITVWTATALNQAGDLPTHTIGKLMCGAAQVRGGALIWTTESLFLLRYSGPPEVYILEQVAAGCGIIGRHAFIVVNSIAYWVGKNTFWRYIGYVEAMACDIADDVFGALNEAHAHKVWWEHRPRHGEVWCHYPRGAATECSHAAVFNYREGHWGHHELPTRTAGVSEGVFSHPIALDDAGVAFEHEKGWAFEEDVLLTDDDGVILSDDFGAPLAASLGDQRFALTGPMELEEGERRLMVDEFIPDERNTGDVEVYFLLADGPNDPKRRLGPFSSSKRVGVLGTARQVQIEYRMAAGSEDARIGNYRAAVKQRGRY